MKCNCLEKHTIEDLKNIILSKSAAILEEAHPHIGEEIFETYMNRIRGLRNIRSKLEDLEKLPPCQ